MFACQFCSVMQLRFCNDCLLYKEINCIQFFHIDIGLFYFRTFLIMKSIWILAFFLSACIAIPQRGGNGPNSNNNNNQATEAETEATTEATTEAATEAPEDNSWGDSVVSKYAT